MVFLVATQILAASLLPRTAAFTNVYWTVGCLGTYAASIWSLSYFIHAGIPLGILIPLLAALVPLGTIAVGVVFYGETASVLKIALLCSSCGLIGVASSVK
jgi:multidrug transporter EmrE-like cation transporter